MAAPGDRIALIGGTVRPSPTEEPVHDGIVLVAGKTIAAVGTRASVALPEGTQVLDCSGSTVTAGLWNSHVHFFERKWANVAAIPALELVRQLRDSLTRYGFTSAFDLSSSWENTRRLRDRIESGEVPGPRIRSTGEGLVPPGAVPPDQVLGVMGLMATPLPEIADAGQAAAAARDLLVRGVDAIKVFASTPRGVAIAEGAIEAAAEEAHRRGKSLFVHPNTAADVLAALRGGADVVGHTTPRSGPWDDKLLGSMKDRGAVLTPTLSIWKHFLRHDRVSTQEQVVDTAVGQLRAWLGAGGTVLFGTDLGAVDPDPTDEYALMGRAGMTFPQILASLTTAPADRFGASAQLGRVAAGFEADLTVLDGDPSQDLGALARVRYTLRAGRIVHQNEKSAATTR